VQNEISERFRELALRPESQIGLAEGALVLASEARGGVDIESGLATIAELAERTRLLLEGAHSTDAGELSASSETPSRAVAALCHSLFEIEGFRGNANDYDDPRNSYLDAVLERRCGLPITLSVLFVEVARRIGLEAYGIGFPGHFLAKVVGVNDVSDGEVIVDPFFACTLSPQDCAERIRATVGDDSPSSARWLRPATTQEIYVRMLNNLKLHFLRHGDALAALGCFDRILVLAPDAAIEYRDRGLLLERMDCVRPAIEDFSRFLELASGDESAATIRRRRDALSRVKPVLN